MDPFNMPSWGSAPNYQADLQQTVAKTAPLAQSYHGAQNGVNIQQVVNQATTPSSGGNLAKLGHFIGGVFHETGSLVEGAAKWLATNVKTMATAPVRFGNSEAHGLLDNLTIQQLNAQNHQNNDRLQSLHDAYRTGKISQKQYAAGLKDLTLSVDSTEQQQKGLQNRLGADQGQTISAGIDTAATLVTILTAGFGRATTTAITGEGAIPLTTQTAGRYLATAAADNYFKPVVDGITKLASDSNLFSKLAPTAQHILQKATAEVVSQVGPRLTGAQIARATAANIALKYPLYFAAFSPTGQKIYQDLDQHQYGDAVRQLAFNAALLLSGGPIGQALKYGGKGIGAVTAHTFGQSSFLDELSKGIGDGSPNGLFKAIMDIKNPEEQKFAIQAISNVEATNLAAVTGKDSVAAAWRVLNGMESYEGLSMSQFTHEEALKNMINFSKAQQLADEAGKAAGLNGITVGRIDAGTKNWLSAQLSPLINGEDKETALNAWDALKAENPNTAWANNENFDRQIKSLINRHDNPGGFDQAMRAIKAASNVKGFPEAVNQQLAKMGYVAIKPAGLEAPFTEGTGNLVTKFAAGEDFFTKAVQPLPILGSLGGLLTHLGLSPTASTSRVYQIFNQNLAANLARSESLALQATKTTSALDEADTLIKKLTEYSHNPTRGLHYGEKALAPITDLRQLTTRDITEALTVSRTQALEIKSSIKDAMLQVPLQVRGLGDKLVDVGYKVNPLQARFLKIQGAARFAWNPFFQAKLAYKTEILAQAEAGGKFPTVLGTNNVLKMIFPDKYNQLDDIRGVLRNAGVFEERAAQFGEGLTGEAVNDVGVSGANLTHKLLPTQERSIAGMVGVQADRLGLTPQEFVTQFPQAARDTVQMIAQYDRNSVFLHSALARTMNLAFFPFRFEYKVAAIMARGLARTSATTQLAVINGLYRAHDWMNSPEGQVWYSQNSEVLQLIRYFTPVQTLGEVTQILGGHPDAIGSFGELGGLPFGWIPQLLDAEGLTHFGGGYVSTKTGQPLPSYIPQTDKGKLAAAIQDLVTQLYTYPGTEVGLPSKTSINRSIALGVTGASTKKDFSKVTPAISPRQQNYAQTIQQFSQQSLNQPANTVLAGTQQLPSGSSLRSGTTVPAQPSQLTTPVYKTKRAGNGTSRKKKSQFTPELLPGQSSLGQL